MSLRFTIITLFPEMIENFCSVGVLAQAQKKDLVSIHCINPRSFTHDKHKTVDDRPFGGGDGMLMMAEPLAQSLESIPEKGVVIYLTPQGRLLNDSVVQEFQKYAQITLICGRYSGVDQRFINKYVDHEISVGDYVLSGGELAAAVFIDSVSRFVPGVLGHEQSAIKDSITQGFLEAPQFAKPRAWQNQEVPEVLLSGHHENIEQWKYMVGLLKTLQKRPEILKLKSKEKQQLSNFWMDLSEKDKEILGFKNFDLHWNSEIK